MDFVASGVFKGGDKRELADGGVSRISRSECKRYLIDFEPRLRLAS